MGGRQLVKGGQLLESRMLVELVHGRQLIVEGRRLEGRLLEVEGRRLECRQL